MLHMSLLLSLVLFTIGMVIVITRRNAIIIFMGIELMLNAANIAMITFSKLHNTIDGHIFVFMSITVAAAEAAVGLAIIISMYRHLDTIFVNKANSLSG